MFNTPLNPAQRRYERRVLTSSAAYAVLLIGEQYLLKHVALPAAARFLLAVLPALAIVAIFVALGRYLAEERDEYLRGRVMLQMLWGTGLALSALTLWGFPADAGLLPHLPLYFAAVFWFAGFGLAALGLKAFDR